MYITPRISFLRVKAACKAVSFEAARRGGGRQTGVSGSIPDGDKISNFIGMLNAIE